MEGRCKEFFSLYLLDTQDLLLLYIPPSLYLLSCIGLSSLKPLGLLHHSTHKQIAYWVYITIHALACHSLVIILCLQDIGEAALMCCRLSANAVPEEIVVRTVLPITVEGVGEM